MAVALKTKPLNTMKKTVTDVIVVTLAQEIDLVFIMIIETATTSQLLVNTRTKVTMTILVTNQGPILFSLRIQIMAMPIKSMMMTLGDEKGN